MPAPPSPPAAIAALFDEDPRRAEDFRIAAADLLIDVSRQRIDRRGLTMMIDRALGSGLEVMRRAMFAGEPINTTEGRAVLHTALRRPPGPVSTGEPEPLVIEGVDVMADVHRRLAEMQVFAESVRSSDRWTDVVSIGIGGSYLGPVMATEALEAFAAGGPRLHFVSNVDGTAIDRVITRLDPRRTLVIIESKTFTTVETMANAVTARQWLIAAVGEGAISDHLVGVTAAAEVAEGFGVGRTFGFGDYIGGRYSICSAIGLPVMIAIGSLHFGELLAGHRDLDEHFLLAPPAVNAPVVLGAIGVWNREVLGCSSKAIVPYCEELARFVAYVQQLDMESNGKSVTRDGRPVSGPTGPVIWGSTGTDAQHAYFQLLHQGTEVVPVDFIGFARANHPHREHQDLLIGNLIAQAGALAFGRSRSDAPHRSFPGNRPSTLILAERLTPRTLGQLIALYEHTVFVEGVMWGINSFDQWGVELGKELAGRVSVLLDGGRTDDIDSASRSTIRWYLDHR